MSDSAGDAAEPWFAPLWRFGRTVLLLDLAMSVVVAALSIWNGWTSAEESSTAILAGGVVLGVIGLLPFVAPMLAALQPQEVFTQFPVASSEERPAGVLRISALFVTAGLLAIAYAAAVKTLFG